MGIIDAYVVNGESWFGTSIPLDGYTRLRVIKDARILGRRRLSALTNKARDRIATWLQLCDKPSVSFSCGKDSLVVLHLARALKPDILVVRHSSAEPHLPDVVEMLSYWQQQGAKIENFVFGSLFEMYERYGLEDTRIDQQYKKRVEAYERTRGIDGAVRGVRAEESRQRKNLRQYGGHMRRQNGIWVLDPIIDWRTDDVWAYIAMHGLPYCQLYDLEDGQERDKRRLGSIWGTSAAQYGRLVWLKKHYPEHYQLFVSRFPEVSQYG